MSDIEETLENYGFNKHTVLTKPDPRGPEYGMLEITSTKRVPGPPIGTCVTVRPSDGNSYTMVFPRYVDFKRWLRHQL